MDPVLHRQLGVVAGKGTVGGMDSSGPGGPVIPAAGPAAKTGAATAMLQSCSAPKSGMPTADASCEEITRGPPIPLGMVSLGAWAGCGPAKEQASEAADAWDRHPQEVK